MDSIPSRSPKCGNPRELIASTDTRTESEKNRVVLMTTRTFLRGKTVLQYASKITYNVQDVFGVTWGLSLVVEEEGSVVTIASSLKTKQSRMILSICDHLLQQ